MANRATLLLAWLWGLSLAQAESSCSRDRVCIEPESSWGQVRFYARNLTTWPVTVTLSVDSDSARPELAQPVTVTLPGRERRLIQTLSARSEPSPDYRYRYDWTVGSLDPEHDDRHRYRLPWAAGEQFRVLQEPGASFSHIGRERHAIDFDLPEGTPVHAARAGVVAMVVDHHDRGCWEKGCERFANYVVILHEDGTTGEYYHLQQASAQVREGDRVSAGHWIARSGNTGHSTMPHLHFAVYRAAEWGTTQSLKIRFETADGEVRRLRAGQSYRAD